MERERAHVERRRTLLAILLLLIIASPGSLMLFVGFSEIAPFLLIFIFPLVLVFVFLFRRYLMNSRQQEVDSETQS
ncbi:MAG: hypothetical protein ACXADL_17245 [Candidatus Thorarchaeota archaeon]|jgi:hypothetical protein